MFKIQEKVSRTMYMHYILCGDHMDKKNAQNDQSNQ